MTIPGIGALNATALVAAVGEARTFGRGRDLAAWLGLVPRQATTGGRPKLLGITKRGSKYLRKMLIQGARASMPVLRKSDTRLGAWLRALLARSHPNTAVVALAAKLLVPAMPWGAAIALGAIVAPPSVHCVSSVSPVARIGDQPFTIDCVRSPSLSYVR